MKIRQTVDDFKAHRSRTDEPLPAPVDKVLTCFVYPAVPHDITEWPDELLDKVTQAIEEFELATASAYIIRDTYCEEVEPICPPNVPVSEWQKRRFLIRVYLQRRDYAEAKFQYDNAVYDVESGGLIGANGETYSRN